jgi:hypothetical protein
VSLPGIYLDEDAQSEALIRALRARGINVLTTTESAMTNHSDEAQLAFALEQNRVLVTCNIGDFASLHRQWHKAGHDHAGLILIHQQKWGPGELARRIIRLLAGVSVADLKNRMEFIGNW